jgi:iron(III) transport system substrate-binding protein
MDPKHCQRKLDIVLNIAALVSLISMLLASHAAAATPPLKIKKEVEGKGFVFFTTHDEIVAGAKKERKLSVSSGLEMSNFKPWINAFKQKYPFISDVHIEEIVGSEGHQRFILQIKSGRATTWDITHVDIDFYPEYIPYLMKYDILRMAKQGVLKIDSRMIHPVDRNMIAPTSVLSAVSYNRALIADDKVPTKWEDFLKPELGGKKFAMLLRPSWLASLVSAWGLEKTLDFARKIPAQQPIWLSGGGGRANTGVAAGEYPIYLGSNYSGVKRAMMRRDPTMNLRYKVPEPAPLRALQDGTAILHTAEHPHTALLWLEFLASPEGQEIIDKYEPLKASVFTANSAISQEVRGKDLSVVDWHHFAKFQEYSEKIIGALGFPKADK